MTSINFFKSSAKRELEAERERLRHSWDELNRREKAFMEKDEFGRIHMIPADRIIANPNQPRKQFDDESIISLADSIRIYGILQPLTVRRINGDEQYGPAFEIIAGERRFRAAKMIGFVEIPCIIINVDSKKSAELAIIENIQRESLNIFEQASAIASLIDLYHLTQEEVARQLSTSQSFVANKLRILRLTLPEREKILAYNLTERHARALLKIQSVEQRLRIIDYIYLHNLNVATTESYIDRFLAENESSRRPRSPRKIVLKDIRIFYNSIDKAVSIIKQAGIPVESQRTEGDDVIELTIRIPKSTGTAQKAM
ncbi:MAG: ParB/RepB/Spo0J family partition protein [Ruminococcaceae bacterium]|nr:ParB/RepB/Spo0J family partition protein [Oscillospiraceae bacterium]